MIACFFEVIKSHTRIVSAVGGGESGANKELKVKQNDDIEERIKKVSK